MAKTLYPLYIVKYSLVDGGEDYDSLPLFGTSEHQLIAFSSQEAATNFYAHPYNLQIQQTLSAVDIQIEQLLEKHVDPLIEKLSKSFPVGYIWLDPEMEDDGYNYNSGIHILLHAPIPGDDKQETDAVVLAQAIDNMRKNIAQMQDKVAKWEILLTTLQSHTPTANSKKAAPPKAKTKHQIKPLANTPTKAKTESTKLAQNSKTKNSKKVTVVTKKSTAKKPITKKVVAQKRSTKKTPAK